MSSSVWKISTLCSVLLIAAACKEEDDNKTELLNTRWVLSGIENTGSLKFTPYPDRVEKIVMVFTDSLDVVTLDGICNEGNGTFSYSPLSKELKINNMRLTLRACQFVEWEGYVVNMLDKIVSYDLPDEKLIIYSTGEYNLHFTTGE